MKGKIIYCIVDETDPYEEFECEGEVVATFLRTSGSVDLKRSLSLVRRKIDIERALKRHCSKPFNIFHIAAHGAYLRRTKGRLDHASIYRTRGRRDVEIMRPDTLVRAKVQCDLLLSTCCESFNKYFLEVIEGYGGVRNFIAPAGDPLIGDTMVFAMMFYNDLLCRTCPSKRWLGDRDVIASFRTVRRAYLTYGGEGRFRLYNHETGKIYG